MPSTPFARNISQEGNSEGRSTQTSSEAPSGLNRELGRACGQAGGTARRAEQWSVSGDPLHSHSLVAASPPPPPGLSSPCPPLPLPLLLETCPLGLFHFPAFTKVFLRWYKHVMSGM